jgi:hypothetical protein
MERCKILINGKRGKPNRQQVEKVFAQLVELGFGSVRGLVFSCGIAWGHFWALLGTFGARVTLPQSICVLLP